jgi:hypothetical protein
MHVQDTDGGVDKFATTGECCIEAPCRGGKRRETCAGVNPGAGLWVRTAGVAFASGRVLPWTAVETLAGGSAG